MQEPQKKSFRLLIVDDTKGPRELLRQFFDCNDFVCDTAENGREGVRKSREARYDLILMDAEMPEMDGITATKLIKQDEALAEVPVIMFTAHDDMVKRKEAVEAGVDEFVPKTSDFFELMQRVRNLIKMKDYVRLKAEYQTRLEKEIDAKTIELQRAMTDLEKLNMEILHRISLAAEYRDDITGKHTERVGIIARILAEAMGFDDDFCESLRHTAPLHDAGKIGVPDHILLKPGKLTPEEWEVMKSHTLMGGKLLGGSESPLLGMAETIAVYHHERWDGGGYPHRLEGDQIPVEGRIVSVADAFDAITTKRPYKDALSYEAALVIVEKERGRQFDPDATDAFVRNFALVVDRLKDILGEPS